MEGIRWENGSGRNSKVGQTGDMSHGGKLE